MVGFITAYQGLVKIARLQKGETVLVHGATGGVGLAAIELAKWIGAEVIGTAGSSEKRNHLRSLGITRVTTSREVSFADDVMGWTEGRGVDVVLNFSPGELMTKSLACVAPFGRFIEIGKMSFEQDAPLSLRPFNENLLYASLDVDRLLASRPDYAASLVTDVLALMDEKKLGSIPVTLFPASRIDEAFRLMARSKHIGKVCVAMRDPELQLRVHAPRRIRPDASYLVTGGLGGFGLETAKWLADDPAVGRTRRDGSGLRRGRGEPSRDRRST
jgi:NADPH:quinone reductase-like Zn-dependent oxidoreductase